MSITTTEALVRCIEHREIFHDEMLALWRKLMSGELSPVQIAAVTMGLRVKKETIGEIAAAAKIMREFATHVQVVDPHRLLDETGIGFMFAPNHHAAMKHAAPVRKELGVRTIFNILGPLTNPAGAANQLMGVFHPDLVGIQVRVLQQLGSRHVVVVYGKDGMDEVSLGAATMVGELKNGEVREYEIHPEDFGLSMISNRGLKVTNANESLAMILEALGNTVGTPREIVVLNSGVALYASDVAATIDDGIRLARETIASGAAKRKLEQFVAMTQKLAA